MLVAIKCECGSNLKDGIIRTLDQVINDCMVVESDSEFFIECAGCGFLNDVAEEMNDCVTADCTPFCKNCDQWDA
jgi:hypothetical protein